MLQLLFAVVLQQMYSLDGAVFTDAGQAMNDPIIMVGHIFNIYILEVTIVMVLSFEMYDYVYCVSCSIASADILNV